MEEGTPKDEGTPKEEPVDDVTSTATDESKPTDDTAAPAFPKALKAKKKQRKLEARQIEDAQKPPELVEQEVEERRFLEDSMPAFLEPTTPEETVPKAEEPKLKRREGKKPRHKPRVSQDTEADPKDNMFEVLEPTAPEVTKGVVEEPRLKPREGKKPRHKPRVTQDTEADPEKPRLGTRPPRETRRPRDGKGDASHGDKSDKKPLPWERNKAADEKREGREAGKAEDDPQEPPPKRENWQSQKAALKEKFPEGWSPRKRLSPDALAGIRALHQQFPEEYTTEVLANKFEVSAEAVRRILKSKWEPMPEEEIERQERWFSRGKRIWSAWAEEGKKPPTKWRKEGITRDPSYHEQRRARSNAQRKLAKTLM